MTLRVERVTHLLAPAPFGGLETVLSTLVKAQQALGLEVTVLGVFSSPPRDQPFWEAISNGSADAVPIVLPGRDYLGERRALARELQSRRAQVLHTHGYRPDVVGGPVARRLDIRSVSTVHGFTGGSLKNRFYEWLQIRAFRRFDAVVAVSARLRRQLGEAGVPEDRLHMVPNALEPTDPPVPRAHARAALGLSPGPRIIGWVGRMGKEKGPDVMLASYRELLSAGTSAALSFVGDGPMREALEREAGNLGDRVRFHGRISQIGRLMPAFDVLALTSWTEGTPMVLLEAMAAGVPVVTTAVGGIPDVVTGAEAVLVPAGDTAAIAAGLEATLAGGDPVRQRVAASRACLARGFAVGPWAERYRTVYEHCLEG